MTAPDFRKGMSFQTKVLLPVLIVMTALMGVTVFIVNQRFTSQVTEEAVQRLQTAQAVFENSHRIRQNHLLVRYGNIANEPSAKGISQLGSQERDAKTVRFSLKEMLDTTSGCDLVLFTTADGEYLAGVTSDTRWDPDRFAADCRDALQTALEGQPNVQVTAIRQKLFDVINVPVTVSGGISGVFTFVHQVGGDVVQEFKQLTRSEVVFFKGDQVLSSSLVRDRVQQTLQGKFDRFLASNAGPSDFPSARPVEFLAEHFLALGGSLKEPPDPTSPGYLLLASYEQPLQNLRATQRMLLFASLLGMAASSLVIWFLVRRVTRPLRELRRSAEAVGGGDFSRKVPVTSSDECGQLAMAFNQMIGNLKASREELEETVQRLKTTQAQLVQSEKLSAVGEFIAGVTHELNNPLTTVIGFSELLEQHDVDKKLRHYLDLIANGAKRCQNIVKNLLSFARQHPPERNWADINELLESTLAFVDYGFHTSNIRVLKQCQPGLPRLWVDPHQLQQVFLNLLHNAQQAISDFRPDGQIQVTSELSNNRVRVTIADNGPGIRPENLRKIFDPFFTTKEVGKGTGLGLSLAYGIMQEHGGTIRAQSSPGNGTSFIMELPLASSSQTESAPPKPPAETHPTFARHINHLLVIDDEPATAMLIRDFLADFNCQVDLAQDGNTGLQMLRRQPVDAVICDWKMPGLNGRHVYGRVKEIRPELSSRILFVTGDVVNEQFRAFIQEQRLACLEKPFKQEDLKNALNRLVQGEGNTSEPKVKDLQEAFA